MKRFAGFVGAVSLWHVFLVKDAALRQHDLYLSVFFGINLLAWGALALFAWRRARGALYAAVVIAIVDAAQGAYWLFAAGPRTPSPGLAWFRIAFFGLLGVLAFRALRADRRLDAGG